MEELIRDKLLFYEELRYGDKERIYTQVMELRGLSRSRIGYC